MTILGSIVLLAISALAGYAIFTKRQKEIQRFIAAVYERREDLIQRQSQELERLRSA